MSYKSIYWKVSLSSACVAYFWDETAAPVSVATSNAVLIFISCKLFEGEMRCKLFSIWSNLSNTKLQNFERLQTRTKTLIENSRLKDGWRCNCLSVSNVMQFDRAVK